MAWSPSWASAYDGEANLTVAEIISSEEWATSYQDPAMSNATSKMDRPAPGWGHDATIDPALLLQQHVSADIPAYDTPVQQP